MQKFETGNEISKVRNFDNIEGERNANGNQTVILGNRLKKTLLVKKLSICLSVTLLMRRFIVECTYLCSDMHQYIHKINLKSNSHLPKNFLRYLLH